MPRVWGKFYWGRKEEGEKKAEGIVVVFAWLSSKEKHIRPYVDLYWSLGWGTLVCHVDFLALFFPQKATKLACSVLNELIKELKVRPLPIVLASFSGGSKGCLYKVLQVINGECKGQHSQGDYQLVRDCLSGQMYDSSPADFTSSVGTRFVLDPSVLKLSHPPWVVAWMVKAFASGLDALLMNRFEAERAEYWQTLYSSVNTGPFLILCSEDDELAPYSIIHCFAKRLQELCGDVNLVTWSRSAHVAHYRYHQSEYSAAVSDLLLKASRNFSKRWLVHTTTGDQVPVSFRLSCNAAASFDHRPKQTSPSSGDHFFVPISTGETTCGSKLFDLRRTEPIRPSNRTLFDKNVEGWDLKPISSLGKSHVCIKRSRL